MSTSLVLSLRKLLSLLFLLGVSSRFAVLGAPVRRIANASGCDSTTTSVNGVPGCAAAIASRGATVPEVAGTGGISVQGQDQADLDDIRSRKRSQRRTRARLDGYAADVDQGDLESGGQVIGALTRRKYGSGRRTRIRRERLVASRDNESDLELTGEDIKGNGDTDEGTPADCRDVFSSADGAMRGSRDIGDAALDSTNGLAKKILHGRRRKTRRAGLGGLLNKVESTAGAVLCHAESGISDAASDADIFLDHTKHGVIDILEGLGNPSGDEGPPPVEALLDGAAVDLDEAGKLLLSDVSDAAAAASHGISELDDQSGNESSW